MQYGDGEVVMSVPEPGKVCLTHVPSGKIATGEGESWAIALARAEDKLDKLLAEDKP